MGRAVVSAGAHGNRVGQHKLDWARKVILMYNAGDTRPFPPDPERTPLRWKAWEGCKHWKTTKGGA